ncbi:MAG: ferrous iron transporter B [Clostridia bacterium]|nr:ferrous iron transporter B [Clostridia bacterium]
MSLKIALAGNPNSGKTTLCNALTGSNQFVGNWPGVTVEKKEGALKKNDDVTIVDLPGIYSLSPYTLEEVVARNYLIGERPDAILNLVDGTNLERNLYLTTQLTEIGLPVVVAINMMDIVEKTGDKINIDELSRAIGCPVVEISALKGTGISEAAQTAIDAVSKGTCVPRHTFSGEVEHALAHIEEAAVHEMSAEQQRWYAVKIFERDEKVLSDLKLPSTVLKHIENDIALVEQAYDDDAESIIANERYEYIATVVARCCKRKRHGNVTTSDKIDLILTNRILGLPLFALMMFLVYFVSVTTVGTWVTDWANDGVFGDGWHLPFTAGAYEEAVEAHGQQLFVNDTFVAALETAQTLGEVGAEEMLAAAKENDFSAFDEAYASYAPVLSDEAQGIYETVMAQAPAPQDYGVWVPGVPVLLDRVLLNVEGDPVIAPWLYSLIQDGIVGGVGAVLGFVPQILVLFLILAFLESCGYMSRIAFVMDRLFRKFGLSGKSFIPMLVGTGCGVPGIMSSRTIENESDRRMTIMTTTFIPCGAKMPIIALIAAACFDGAWWVAPSAYFLGMAAIVVSGIMLKKTPMFAGDPAPFVMELPAYHLPPLRNVLRSMWERGWSFIKKAGTIILLSSIFIWFINSYGVYGNSFVYLPGLSESAALSATSLLEYIGSAICWLFVPLGFGDPTAAVATVMGLLAKEEVVAVFGVTEFAAMAPLAAYSFMVFNLLCAPCFAAMAAIRREMNSASWTAFAIGYQCVFAYAIALIVFQVGSALTGGLNVVGLTAAVLTAAVLVFMLVRPNKERSRSPKKRHG